LSNKLEAKDAMLLAQEVVLQQLEEEKEKAKKETLYVVISSPMTTLDGQNVMEMVEALCKSRSDMIFGNDHAGSTSGDERDKGINWSNPDSVAESFWFKGYCDRAKGLVTALVQQGHALELVCIEGGPICQLEARSMERIKGEVSDDLKSRGVSNVDIVTRRMDFEAFKTGFVQSGSMVRGGSEEKPQRQQDGGAMPSPNLGAVVDIAAGVELEGGIPSRVLTPDGQTVDLGELIPSQTVQSVKAALAAKSGIPAGSQHLFWLEDTRKEVEDFALKDDMLLSEAMAYTGDATDNLPASLEFSVFIGEVSVVDFVSALSPKPDYTIDNGLDRPIGVAFVPSRPHLLLVADFGAHCVVLCNMLKKEVVATFGKQGSGNGEFERPYGVVATESEEHGLVVVVSEWSNARLQVIRLKLGDEDTELIEGSPFEFMHMIGQGEGEKKGMLNNPLGLCIRKQPAVGADDTGEWIERRVLVAESTNGRISEFDIFTGECIACYGGECIAKPYGVAALSNDRGGFVVADSSFHSCLVFDATFGISSEGGPCTAKKKFGSMGTGNGLFKDPTGVAVDSYGNMVVVDAYTKRMQVFKDGSYMCGVKGVEGFSTGQDKAIAWDGGSGGCLAVGDYNAQCILIWGCHQQSGEQEVKKG
jgi:hypothetical protein